MVRTVAKLKAQKSRKPNVNLPNYPKEIINDLTSIIRVHTNLNTIREILYKLKYECNQRIDDINNENLTEKFKHYCKNEINFFNKEEIQLIDTIETIERIVVGDEFDKTITITFNINGVYVKQIFDGDNMGDGIYNTTIQHETAQHDYDKILWKNEVCNFDCIEDFDVETQKKFAKLAKDANIPAIDYVLLISNIIDIIEMGRWKMDGHNV